MGINLEETRSKLPRVLSQWRQHGTCLIPPASNYNKYEVLSTREAHWRPNSWGVDWELVI